MVDIQWLIGGEAGYGIMTTGAMMSKIFTRLGLNVFDYVEYPSLIRGGHNAYYVRGSDQEITSQKINVDILVALNSETISLHAKELSDNASVLFDPSIIKVTEDQFDRPVKLYPVPFIELAKSVGADRLMMNTVSVGSSLALFHDSFDVLSKIMQDAFGDKGENVVNLNINTSRKGFDYQRDNFGICLAASVSPSKQEKILIGGAEAISLGAIQAGVKFAAIYPMTPINAVMTTLVSHALKYNIIVKEPEDEIAAINMALGASFAGVRAMTATSGGGFSLMAESLGLSSQTETPLVIIMGMRPGPATGMPTWTDQGDLRFVIHAAQGDFPRIVLAPGDLFEAFSYTMDAFNLAEVYQMPVIVLVDKYLNEGHGTVLYEKIKEKISSYKINRGKILSDQEAESQQDYKRYLLTDDGISPRSIPGQKGGIALSGSDEHDEKGLYNEHSDMRIKMMNKRFKKLELALDAIPGPEMIGDEDADLTIVAFGSTKLPILDAVRQLKEIGKKVNLLKVSYMHPFKKKEFIEQISKAKKTMILEANYSGQFEGLIREETGITFENRLRKFDGRPFYPEEIIEKVKQLI